MAIITDPLTRIDQYVPKKLDYVLSKGLKEPFNNHNAASRKKMYNVHNDHRTDLINSEIAFCDTGYANEYGRYNSAVLLADMEYEIVAKISKFEHLPEHDYILILRNPTNNSYTIYHRVDYNYLTETNGYKYNNKYMDSKKVGDVIKQGDVIRKSSSYDDYGNKMDGINLNGVFMNIAKTCEDGIILSEAVRPKFDTPVFKPKRISINTNNVPLNLYGKDGSYKVCPFVGEEVKDGILMGTRLKKNEEQFYSASQDRLRKIMTSDVKVTIGSGVLIDCDIYCNDPELLFTDSKYSQLAMIYMNQQRFSREIVNVLEPIVNDKSIKKSYDLEELYLFHKRILDGQHFLNEKDNEFSFLVIDFMVYEVSRIQIGDKITNRYGGKGVIAGFLPEELMPLFDNGKHADAIWNSAGIVGRLNPGQHIEMESNFISSRIIERMRSPLCTDEEAFQMYFDFLSFVSPNMYRYTKNIVDNMSEQDKKLFLDSIKSYDCIHFQIEPITESYGIDLLDQMYKHFDWIEPYTVMIQQKDSMGNYRAIPTRRKLIAGHIYYYRLKQVAEEKFSTTSLSATNVRGQNTRSRASKLYESPYSRTPVA
jgi:DNA-directed RNA polymerase beta subunit